MAPLIIKDVEVVNINPVLKSFSVIVHVQAAPLQMHTPEVQEHVNHRVRYAVKYLVDEGFIPDPHDESWRCTISGICHPPKVS